MNYSVFPLNTSGGRCSLADRVALALPFSNSFGVISFSKLSLSCLASVKPKVAAR